MTVIQRLGNLKSVWEASNPVLLAGQEVYEIDDLTGEQRLKIGDGTTDYVTLGYVFGNPESGPPDGSVTTAKLADGSVTLPKTDGTIASVSALNAEATARTSADMNKADVSDIRFTDDRNPLDGSVTTAKLADGAVTAAKTDGSFIVGGVADGVTAMGLILPVGDDTSGIIIKSSGTSWGANGQTAPGGDPLYGTGQFIQFEKEGVGTTSDNLLFRVDRTGGLGMTGAMHVATGLRQRAGYAPTQCQWIQPFVDAAGLVIFNADPTAVPSGWSTPWFTCVDVRTGPTVVFEVGPTAIWSRHAGGFQVSGGWLSATGSRNDMAAYVGPPNASDKGLVIRGQASHIDNLFEVQDSTSTAIALIGPTGNIVAKAGIAEQTAIGNIYSLAGIGFGTAIDAFLVRAAADVVGVGKTLQIPDLATVANPPNNTFRLGSRDVSGNSEMYAIFPTGSAVPIARQGSAGIIVGAASVGLTELSATGTPSSANFLRGDNSWQTVTGLTAIADQRLFGNISGGSAVPVALTAAQSKTLLAIANTDVSGLGTASTHAHGDYDVSGAAAAAQAASQPLDSDLTAIAALTTTSFGRAFLALADASATRTAIGAVIGTDVEAHDTDLTTIAGLSPTNDDVVQRKAGAWANRTPAQLKTDLAISTGDVSGLGTAATHAHGDYDLAGAAAAAQSASQPLDSDLTAIAALTTTSFGRAFLALADASAARTAIGTVIGTDVQAYSANAAFRTDKLSALAATTSAELKTVISDETGTGALVFGTSPALTTPTGIVAGDIGGLGSLATLSAVGTAQVTDASLLTADLDPGAITPVDVATGPAHDRYRELEHFTFPFNTLIATAGIVGKTWADMSGTASQVAQQGLAYYTAARGVAYIETGTTTTGRCELIFLYLPPSFTAASTEVTFGARILLPAVSDGTNTFEVRAGLGQSYTAVGTDGLFFRGSNANWRAINRRASTETDTDTTIALAATTWVNLKVQYSAATGNATFYVNGTLRATTSTNKPTDATALYPFVGIYKSAGTTTRAVSVDAMYTSLNIDTDLEQIM